MHRTSLKEKMRQYLFLFPKVRGDTQTDNDYPRDSLLGVYRTMALQQQSSQQDFIDYNHKSVAMGIGDQGFSRGDASRTGIGGRGSGIGYWAEKNHQYFNYQLPITNYQLPTTHYPLPITNCLKHCPWQEARRKNN
ncbi:hypothetical protein ACE1AT_22720 [Pelatocladus sp. BLCC-F211]|uniref:hypothetical protein n=1 Tax=Pelatocladus sp. BLCC-F211 TaxID=3342752 RepID=UPI0035BAA3A5